MQQDEAARKRPPGAVAAGDAERAARRQSVLLARARAAADLARATNPAHRTMLETAIDALDRQLAAIDEERDELR